MDDVQYSGLAFPFDRGSRYEPGLTKREYFAAQALMGEISRCGIEPVNIAQRVAMVDRCFIFADLMIERAKS